MRFRLAALLALALVPSLAAAAPSSSQLVLPFIEDDYGRALALARSKQLPIFVENWAPW